MRLQQSAAWLPSLRRQWFLPLLLNTGVVLSTPALADEGDVLRPYVGFSMTHDDNILATSKISTTPKLSDTARRLEAGLLVDKTFSRQRLTADINFDKTSFNRFENLDYNGRDIKGNWNWLLGSHVDGNLGLTHSRALTSVQDSLESTGLPSRLPNVRTQDRQYFDAGWRFHPSWRVRGGISRYELDYDQPGLQTSNRTINDGEVGIDYLARSGSSIGVQVGHAEGDFAFSPANNYGQDEFKTKVVWKLTGKTDLQFLAGWVRREHDLTPAQDFSGFNGRMNATWRATNKITVDAGVWREIGALDDVLTAFSLNEGISIGAGWEIDAKLRLDGYYQHEQRDYTPANLPRTDNLNYSSLRLTYYPIRNLRIHTAVYQTVQNSNDNALSYRNKGLTVGTRYEF